MPGAGRENRECQVGCQGQPAKTENSHDCGKVEIDKQAMVQILPGFALIKDYMIFKINPAKLASRVKFDISQEDCCLDIWARSPRGTVGYAFGCISKDRLCLCDLKVYDAAYVSYPFANNIFVVLFGPYQKSNFRGLGIGSRLLAEFIAEARKLGIREIWGSVQDGDTMQTPHLLDFYIKHGFSITEPDAECMDIAKWKIVMKLP